MQQWRKRPVVIDALQFDGTNQLAIRDWIRENGGVCAVNLCARGDLFIRTLEGDMEAKPGDYVIRGVQGEFYPCKPHIFEATYEQAE